MNIIRCDRELETERVDRTLRAWGHQLTLLPQGIDEKALCSAIAECDLLLMCYTPVTSRVVASAPHLRGIVKYGVGIDAIDIPAAHARGIAVVNVPDYAAETVAEGAFAMLIALAKRLPSLQQAMRRTGWVWPTGGWLGSEIAGKTSAILINSARGALVDEVALLRALKEGGIAGAGLDVFSQEPLNQTCHPLRELYSMDNVILSPHFTFFTTEAMERLESETLERCREIIEGRPVTIRSTDPRLQRCLA